MNKKLAISSFVLILFFSLVCCNGFIQAHDLGFVWRFSIDEYLHENYGLAVPVTYIFTVSEGSVAYVRFDSDVDWSIVDSQFFDEEVAYVSVAFCGYSNYFEVCFQDSLGFVSSEYLGSCRFYENKRVTYMISVDDVGREAPWGTGEDYVAASKAFVDNGIVWSGGIQTDKITDWGKLQALVDTGFFEVASHSRSHPWLPYENYVSEIEGSKQDLVDGLSFSSLYRNGEREYVWLWIEPGGNFNSAIKNQLVESKYLVSRSTDCEVPVEIKGWSSGLFDRCKVYLHGYMDDESLFNLKYFFDCVYDEGGIFVGYCHIGVMDWDPGERGYEYLRYVGGRSDVWYVGLGAFYAYQFTRLNVDVSMVYEVEPSPTVEPTCTPTPTASQSTSPEPTSEPSPEPTVEPTITPTLEPTFTLEPTPTEQPQPIPENPFLTLICLIILSACIVVARIKEKT